MYTLSEPQLDENVWGQSAYSVNNSGPPITLQIVNFVFTRRDSRGLGDTRFHLVYTWKARPPALNKVDRQENKFLWVLFNPQFIDDHLL